MAACEQPHRPTLHLRRRAPHTRELGTRTGAVCLADETSFVGPMGAYAMVEQTMTARNGPPLRRFGGWKHVGKWPPRGAGAGENPPRPATKRPATSLDAPCPPR